MDASSHTSKDNLEKVQVDTAGIIARPLKLQVEIHYILKLDVNHIYD
jgi:SUMO ligase MMS21 Smc5/6 complex component